MSVEVYPIKYVVRVVPKSALPTNEPHRKKKGHAHSVCFLDVNPRADDVNSANESFFFFFSFPFQHPVRVLLSVVFNRKMDIFSAAAAAAKTRQCYSKRVVVRNDAFPNDDDDDEKEDKSRGDDEEEKEENVQQIDVRDDAALAKIGLKWNDDYTELLDVKTGKPLDDFEELQRKQQKASRFDIAVRAMRGEFTKARGKTEGEVYGEIMDTLTRYPIVYTFQASAKAMRSARRIASETTNQRDGGNEMSKRSD